jgi:hypothetical protein
MDLAVRTTASPAAIWVICVVAVGCLAFWLIMVMVVANRPDPRFRRVAAISGPVFGGIHMATGGRGVEGAEPEAARVPPQRGPEGREPQAPAEPATAPAEPIPEQRTKAGDTAPTDTAGSGTAGRP